jgi:predicted phosphodiesterase
VVELGLSAKLVTRDAVNSLLDTSSDQAEAFARLGNYGRFCQEYFGTVLDGQNPTYFTARTVDVRGLRVGVACLNSAWRCSGDSDRGKLVVGERQVDAAVAAVAGADLRIGLMHHPFDWFTDHDAGATERLCLSGLHVLLRGHLHQPKVEVRAAPHGNCAFLPAGAIFNHRRRETDYLEGYSLLSIGRQYELHLRRYYDGRRAFDADVDSAAGGRFSFRLDTEPAAYSEPRTEPVFPEAATLLYAQTFDAKKELIRAREAAIRSGAFEVTADQTTRASFSPWDFDRITVYLYHEHESTADVASLAASVEHELEVLQAKRGNETLVPFYYAIRSLISRRRVEVGDPKTSAWRWAVSQLFVQLPRLLTAKPRPR